MKKLIRVLLLAALGAMFAVNAQAATLIYIPCDDRPVCLDYTVDTLKSAGYEIMTPPAEMLATRYRFGNSDKLWAWLNANAVFANAAVISADSMVYGGLVPSRTHSLEEQVIKERVAQFATLRETNPTLKLYVFATLMRSPRMSAGGTEPPYYEKIGPQIFRLGALTDKKELQGLSRQEQKEFDSLLQSIPKEDLEDWSARRAKNLQVHQQLIEYARKNVVDYYLVGRDDSSPLSYSHRELRTLNKMSAGVPVTRFTTFGGADQLGMILLTRAFNSIEGKLPYISIFYAPGAGGKTVPSYQDNTADENIRGQIIASGSFPAFSPDRADMILAVNTPGDGITREAASPFNISKLNPNVKTFVNEVEKYLTNKKPVAVASISFGNGADNALAQELMSRKMLPRLRAFAGWNTASNTIGYAIGQGTMAGVMSAESKNRLMAVRLLDEWAYQANVRQDVIKSSIYPVGGNVVHLGDLRSTIEAETDMKLHQFADLNFKDFPYGEFTATHPWDRMFEVKIDLRKEDK